VLVIVLGGWTRRVLEGVVGMSAVGKRRLAIAAIAAISAYPDASASFVQGIAAQVRLIEDWIVQAEDAFEVTELSVEAEQPADTLDGFRRQLHGLEPDDAVLVYVTGHGTRGRQSREHRLLLPDNSRYRTADLVTAAMTSGAGHVVVLIDSCHAGTLCQEIFALLEDERQDGVALPTSSCVVVSGRPDETIRLREFATLIRRALDLLATDKYAPASDVRYLSPETFLRALTVAGRQEPVPPQLAWPNALSVAGDPCLALPNPVFDRAEVITRASSRGAALSRSQIHEYWIEKASGRPDPDDPGWYFSGREALMADVVGFLRAPTEVADPRGQAEPGVLVVTGVAGSGKSAAIARAVTLADPMFRTDREFQELVQNVPPPLVPPLGCVDAAVTARGLTAEQVADAVTVALAAAFPGSAGLEPAVADGPLLAARVTRAVGSARSAAGRRVCVVIDGVDEAIDPTAVVRDVVRPLTRPDGDSSGPAARFVLGVRCADGEDDTGAGLLGVIARAVDPTRVLTVRTDGPGARDDVAAYLTALLSTAPSPYWGDGAAAADVAAVVADAVTPRFLDARVVGAALRAAPHRRALDDEAWLASLHDATVAQLRADLQAVSLAIARPWLQVMAVLRATAVAQGAGLPWESVWPVMAQAVHAQPLPDADELIAAVLRGRLGGYLTSVSQAGIRLYRPNHERLTEVLRHHPHRLLPEASP
jgi:hypothetical protein